MTKIDAENLSKTFWKHSFQKRDVENNVIIDNVEVISNDNNKPLAYIINYKDNGGFMIISATREYHPILAYSDSGSYHQNMILESAKQYMNWHMKTIDNIDGVSIEDRQKCIAEWSSYETVKVSENTAKSINNLTGVYDNCRRQSFHQWKSEGKEFSGLKDQYIAYLPEGIRLEYLNQAKANILENANQEDYAMVVWTETPHINQKILSVTSKWEQDGTFTLPYGNMSAPLAGCSPVAMGMLMRYFEWPTTYNWSAMSDVVGTSESRKLLRDIGINAGTRYGMYGSPTDSDGMKIAFDKMGYSYVYESRHLKDKNRASIDANSPVVVVATGSTGNAHTWICDGYKGETRFLEFEFYVMKYNNETGQAYYESIGSFGANGAGGDWEHINWGYNGSGDGWYLENFTSVTIEKQTFVYDKKRGEFRNLKPIR